MSLTKSLTSTTLNSFLTPARAGGITSVYVSAFTFTVDSIIGIHVGDRFKATGSVDRYGVISDITGLTITAENVMDSTGTPQNLHASMTKLYVGYNLDVDGPLNSAQLVNSKTTAKKLKIRAGHTLLILGTDGGEFYGVTGAAPGTYSDNGGNFCGTRFIPTGGNGSSVWLRKYVGAIESVWFGTSTDGSSTDTAAHRLAIDFAASQSWRYGYRHNGIVTGVGTAADNVGHGAMNGPVWNFINIDDKYDCVGTLGPYAFGVQHTTYVDKKGGKTTAGFVQFVQRGAGSVQVYPADNGNALLAFCFTNQNLGGISGNPRGNIYGSNLYALLQAPATFISNLTACEINVENQAGTSADYISGLQIADRKNNRGTSVDAALSLSSALGVGWANCILFSAANGSHPVDVNSTLMKTSGAATAGTGIDLSSYTFNNWSYRSNAFSVDGNGNGIFGTTIARVADTFAPLQVSAPVGQARGFMANNAGGYGLWVGYDKTNFGAGGDCGMLRQTSADPLDIVVNNTTRVLRIQATGNCYASVDNAYTWGQAGARWSEIWAVNGAIQTSDLRQKERIEVTTLGLKFIESLNPVSYNWIIGGNDVSKETVEEWIEEEVLVTEEAVIESIDVIVENGRAIQKIIKTIKQTTIEDEFPVFNEDGTPVIIILPPVLDKAGNILTPQSTKQKVHRVPRTKKVRVKKEVERPIITPRSGKRRHYGFIAQEVEKSLNGVDFGGLVIDKVSGDYALRYDQFISPLVKAVQELSARVVELESKLADIRLK